MENLYLTIKRETLILEHVSFIFPTLSYLPITASFSLIKWLRKTLFKNLTLTNEQLQELYSRVTSGGAAATPRLAPLMPDARRERLSPSTQPPRKVARSVLTSRPSAFPLDCRMLCHCPLLTDHWPHWGHTGGCSSISLGWVTSGREGRKTPPLSSQAVTSQSMRVIFARGSGDISAAHLAFHKG